MTNIDFDAVIAELRNGWRKGGMYGEDGSACLIGAIDRVLSRKQENSTRSALTCFQAASEIVLPVIREQFPERIGRYAVPNNPTARFNDHPDTTLDDVILVCEKARAAQGEIR
jgi:hypothetical protein